MDKVLEIVHELKQENIGRDGSHEYESACKDFRAAVETLKEGEQEMTDNDYIAEYIKEKHASLLGLDFVVWKIGYAATDFFRQIVDIVKSIPTDQIVTVLEAATGESEPETDEEEEGEQE